MKIVGVVTNLTPLVDYYVDNFDLRVGEHCIIKSERGVEFAKVVEIGKEKRTDKEVVRKATLEDEEKNKSNLKDADNVKKKVREIVKNAGLDMRVSKCEYTFDKEKLVIHYTADGRVDFRELVKVLATEFKSRIEMHQINSREETQIMGALGCCGRVCCCNNHLSDFDKVSIKMAKKQGLSLNPQKLNGMCGKLLCCLKYEDEYYTETLCKMPKVASKVETPDGVGVVKSVDCIREMVEVLFENGEETERKSYPLGELNFEKSSKTETD